MTYLFIAILVVVWIWIAYEIIHAPTMKEPEDNDDDPTTTFWHEE
jgi:hypothetical protein